MDVKQTFMLIDNNTKIDNIELKSVKEFIESDSENIIYIWDIIRWLYYIPNLANYSMNKTAKSNMAITLISLAYIYIKTYNNLDVVHDISKMQDLIKDDIDNILSKTIDDTEISSYSQSIKNIEEFNEFYESFINDKYWVSNLINIIFECKYIAFIDECDKEKIRLIAKNNKNIRFVGNCF